MLVEMPPWRHSSVKTSQVTHLGITTNNVTVWYTIVAIVSLQL
jgi:hypothetical protein